MRFVSSNDELIGEDDVPSSQIAEILAKHGVRVVILNACQSASEQGPASNIARSMVEQGVSVAIGMRYEILDSAAQVFTTNFYQQFLTRKQSLWNAMHSARLAVQVNRTRRTKYNTDLDVQDYITPVLFFRPGMSPEDDFTSQASNAAAKADIHRDEVVLYGREADILALETKLINSNVVLLNGSPGTGKSYFIKHLCWWWKTTGFIEDSVVIDCAETAVLSTTSEVAAIKHALAIESPESSVSVLDYLNQHRCLVVLDSVDASYDDRFDHSGGQNSLRRFLRKIKKSFVLVASRSEKQWLKAAAKITYHMAHLDMRSSLQLAMKEASSRSCEIDLSDNLNIRFLEQCLFLVDGNPLAIVLLMKAYCTFRISMKEFYNKLTDGSILDETRPGMFEENQSRGFIDARRLALLNCWVPSQIPVRDDDSRLLAPFWRNFPADLSSYRLFFSRAKNRISSNHKQSVSNKNLKSRTENFTGSELRVLLRKEAFPADELRTFSPMDNIFDSWRAKGFLHLSVLELPIGEQAYYSIHPLVTLALRTKDLALPNWTQHALEVAFQRFIYYRSRVFLGGHLAEKQIQPSLKSDLMNGQVGFELTNYVTAANFIFGITPDENNVAIFQVASALIAGCSNNPRRMPIVLDVSERILAQYGTSLAAKRSSVPARAFKSALGIDSSTADIDGHARKVLELVCIVAVLHASQLANLMNVHCDYSVLLEGIVSNFRQNEQSDDTNMRMAKMARVQLAHVKNPDGESKPEAALEALGVGKAAREAAWPTGPLSNAAIVNYALTEEVTTAKTSEDISRLETKLLDLLEQQLDSIDTARIKALIYECLGVLAMKRSDLRLAIQHLDKAIAFSESPGSVAAHGLQQVVELRRRLEETLTD